MAKFIWQDGDSWAWNDRDVFAWRDMAIYGAILAAACWRASGVDAAFSSACAEAALTTHPCASAVMASGPVPLVSLSAMQPGAAFLGETNVMADMGDVRADASIASPGATVSFARIGPSASMTGLSACATLAGVHASITLTARSPHVCDNP